MKISTTQDFKLPVSVSACFSVLLALTRVVNGVKVDSFGPDETPDPLQLALSHVVLENDVIGEVDAPDRLHRGRTLAGDRNGTALGERFDSHGLGYGALIILHLRIWLLFKSSSTL